MNSTLSDQAARIAELLAADEIRARDISRLTVERDEARAECEGLRAALEEGAEILANLTASIRKNGNYSPESTVIFLEQIGQCLWEANSSLAKETA